MHMPDARDYLATGGPYPTYGPSADAGYAAAAGGAGVAAYGLSDNSTSDNQTQSSTHNHNTNAGLNRAAMAKQREAMADRQRLRLSSPYAEAGGSGVRPESQGSPPLSDGRPASGVYQHTDMGSMQGEEEEGPAEIPPK